MTNQSKIIPKISFKGVFIFLLILFIGILTFPIAFHSIGLSQMVSYFLAAGLSSSIGIILVLTKIDANQEDKPFFKQRVILAIIVGFTSSALMTFVFGGDVLG